MSILLPSSSHRSIFLSAVLIFATVSCSSAPSTTTETTTTTTTTEASTTTTEAWRPLNSITIPAPALTANLLGDPAERKIMVYLPPQYFDGEGPFPTVYYLPGYDDEIMYGVTVPRDFDREFSSLPPMIVVVVPGVNTFGGSFFVDSPVTGYWSRFIWKDLVEFIDSNFNTIPNPASRGIAGHSMGGFGALDISMRHPEVFGSVFAMAPGLFDEDGLQNSQMFEDETYIRRVVEMIDSLEGFDSEEVISRLAASFASFDVGYGMAFSPKTEAPFFDYPYRLEGGTLVRDEAVWSRWESGFGGIATEVEAFSDNLKSLTAIHIDSAANDEYRWIPQGAAYLDSQLTAAGIDHVYLVHEGTHGNRLPYRIIDHMLPFFAENLAR